MKIGIVNTSDNMGGAARAAYRLHQGILNSGNESTLFVQQKRTDDANVYGPKSKYDKILTSFIPRLDSLPLINYPNRNKKIFSTGWLTSFDLTKISSDIDVFNFHWVGNGFQSIDSITNIKKPLILTLHDSWAFTGGCHIPFECDRFINKCGACSILDSSNETDISYKIWKKKFKSWKNKDIVLVGDGTWVASNAEKSSIFKDHRIEVVHPGLDLNTYKPYNKSLCREILGLSDNDKVVLFGAYNATVDTNKGFELLKHALEKLAATFSDIINLKFVVFGASAANESNVIKGIDTKFVGHLNDDISLSILYSCADVMVVPSKYESFGQTASESFACGTPVVAFRTSGLKDIVDHKINGYLADPYDTVDLAEGISWVLSDTSRLKSLSIEARYKAVREFSLEKYTDDYLKIYESVLR